MISLKFASNFLRSKPQVTGLISGEINKALDFAPWAYKHM